ncbi:hypothetical protein ACIPYS_31610 [Kitasatospora sp. NPDC089913]|uniref:hypothetical protein n=1 Tax=Kitasatospora sp. NPDC089913 TaxID=3364080 RepID=UPI00381EFD3C
MADQTVDDRNLWRSVYREDGGWGPDSRFPGHTSAAAPVLVALEDELLCLHLGEPYGKGEHDVLDLRWTGIVPDGARRRAAELDALKERTAGQAGRAEPDAGIAAAEATVAEAVTWAPDAVVDTAVHYEGATRVRYENAVSTGTPAAAVHNGAAHVLLTVRDAEEPDSPVRLVELTYGRPPGAGADAARVWREGRALPVPGAEGAALVPFRGTLHAFVPDVEGGVHCVRDEASGQWRRLEEPVEALAGASSLAAVVHRDGVHVLAGDGTGRLAHVVFDGTAWTAPVEVADAVAVGANVALASSDGVLHAVFPGRGGPRLFHTVFDGGGWTPPVAVEGHDSRHTPALLALTDGPEGDRRSALLMVHRGVDDFVPPPRPAPPAAPSVTGTGGWVVGATVEGYGSGRWSRARAHVEAGPAEFDDDGRATRGVLAEALVRAEYYWGFCYQADTAGIAGRAALYEVVAAPDGGERLEHRSDQDRHFTATAGAVSRSTLTWTGLDPGTYEIRFTGRRSGGYWSATGTAGTVGADLGDADLAVSTVRVTL